jgi:hypothetical protein
MIEVSDMGRFPLLPVRAHSAAYSAKPAWNPAKMTGLSDRLILKNLCFS